MGSGSRKRGLNAEVLFLLFCILLRLNHPLLFMRRSLQQAVTATATRHDGPVRPAAKSS